MAEKQKSIKNTSDMVSDERPHYTSPIREIQRQDCIGLILLAFQEDSPQGDPGSELLFAPESMGEAKILSNEPCTLCGLSLLPFILEIEKEQNGAVLEFSSAYQDGDKLLQGELVAILKGPILSLLRLERTILNFLQYLSGISTATDRVSSIAPEGIFILDTRKTLPGYRRLAKYAVYCGGGVNHRIHLGDMILLKDNHGSLFKGDICQAIESIRRKYPKLPLEVEVESMAQLEEALDLDIDKIMLDNMSIVECRQAYEHVLKKKGKHLHLKTPFLEISGGWTEDKLPLLLGLKGVGVSMGSLTHTTRFVDMSMEIANTVPREG